MFTPFVLRWISWMILVVCVSHLGLRWVRRTPWHKERLYHQLTSGSAEERLRAASGLAQIGAQAQLLAALHGPAPESRTLAQRALEYIWCNAAGEEACARLQSAVRQADLGDVRKALSILDQLVEQYPNYAEGWNRRASVYWQTGDFARSIADCEKALHLNPNHYGAWQGIGVCRLELGDVVGACRSLRAALTVLPFDEVTRNSLQRCEELLRTFPGTAARDQAFDLL